MSEQCVINDCIEVVYAKGLCNRHWRWQQRYRGLPTWEEMENSLGPLLDMTDASKFLGVQKNVLYTDIRKGLWKGDYLLVGKDLAPKPGFGEGRSRAKKFVFVHNKIKSLKGKYRLTRQKIDETKEMLKKKLKKKYGNLPSWEETESEHGKLIYSKEAAKLLGIKQESLLKGIREGKWGGMYLKVGKDLLPNTNTSGHYQKYAFIIGKVLEHQDNFKTLKVIADEEGLNYHRLLDWSEHGWLNEAKLQNHVKWDKSWIVKNYEEMSLRRYFSNQKKKTEYFGMLGETLQEEIEQYLQYRIEKNTIYYANQNYGPFKNRDVAMKVKDDLSRCIYKIICARSGIQNYWQLEFTTSGLGTYRELTPAELGKFDPLLFSLPDTEEDDIKSIMTGLEQTTRAGLRTMLKPFFFYGLMKEKEELRKEKRLISRILELDEREMKMNAWRVKSERHNDTYEAIEAGFRQYTPASIPEPNNQRPKIWLSRRQIVEVIQMIVNNKTSSPIGFQNPLKYATMLLLAFMTGIRPAEMRRVRLEYDIALNTDGFLKTDEFGFGKLTLRPEICKAGGSHKEHGTLIVPVLVEYMNAYLTWLYEKNPKDRGTGYLFRSKDEYPSTCYKTPKAMFAWLWGRYDGQYRVQDAFKRILGDNVDKNFSTYDPRHSVNQLIVNGTRYSSDYLQQNALKAAKLHLRHKGKADVNEDAYQQGLSYDVYRKIIQESLCFPLALQGEDNVDDWEQSRMTEGGAITRSAMTEENKEVLEECKCEIEKIEHELRKLNAREAKSLPFSERVEKAVALEQKKSEWEQKINELLSH